MSIRGRSILGAVALFGGILLLLSGGVWKSSDRIRYERAIERKEANPEPPKTAGGNVVMVLGALLALSGAALIGLAFRDMARQISQAGFKAEAALQQSIVDKREPPSKPPT